MTSDREHWEGVYAEKDPEEVSWFEAVPRSSLEMIEGLGLPADAPIIDVGGGASRLAAELLARGHTDVTVADISEQALEGGREESGEAAEAIEWVVADVRDHDFGRRFAVWHDRAVFHFMVEPEDRRGYVATLERSLEPGGHAIVATFGPEGPTRCSGLPVARYGADGLAEALGPGVELVDSHLEEHRTPSDASQQLLFAHLSAPERSA